MKASADAREEEAQRLQQEIEDAKRQMEVSPNTRHFE